MNDSSVEYYILVEGTVLTESSTVKQALLLLMATYFAFNMKYPKFLSPVYLFLQAYILNFRDKAKITITVSQVHTALLSVDKN